MQLRFLCAIFLTTLFAFCGEAPRPAPPKNETPKPPPPKKIPGDKKAVEMDYGPAMAITVGVTKENIAYKGIVIPLNKEKTLNVLFDTELLRVAAVWKDGFLNWASRVYADNNNDYCTVKGEVLFSTSALPGWSKNGERADPRKPRDGPLPREWAKYNGLYLNGEKVVLSYSVGGVQVRELFALQGSAVMRLMEVEASKAPMELFVTEIGTGNIENNCPGATWDEKRHYLKIPPHDTAIQFGVEYGERSGAVEKVTSIEALTHGGSARWPQISETKGIPSATEDVAYVIDNLTAPDDNPYKSWMRFTGLDFFQDGRAALSTWNGDVWVVSGIDAKMDSLKWKRFATGLNNPMGVKIIDGFVHTVGRDQITKLHDLNNDGEADFYENINNDCFLTTNFHEMCFDLQTDKEGNFYYTKGSSIWAGEQRPTAHTGTFIKVSKDGSQFEVLCRGLRAPNGIGVGPNGELTCSDNQGNWIPACPINLVKKDAYYGWVGQGQKAEEFKTPDKPLCWIPYSMDKSTSGQIWADAANTKWGPFAGRMLVTSYDCWLLTCFIDRIDGDAQGGVVKFPLKFASGMMRPRFNPADGQLYIAGLKGWSSSAARDCQFARVRYTGKPVCMPLEAHLTKTGFEVLFSDKLDAASATDKQLVSAEWFNIVRTSGYGSPDFSVSDPKKKGREQLEIGELKLKEDGKTLVVSIANLKPVTNLVLKFNVKSAAGAAVKYELAYTINRMP